MKPIRYLFKNIGGENYTYSYYNRTPPIIIGHIRSFLLFGSRIYCTDKDYETKVIKQKL